MRVIWSVFSLNCYIPGSLGHGRYLAVLGGVWKYGSCSLLSQLGCLEATVASSPAMRNPQATHAGHLRAWYIAMGSSIKDVRKISAEIDPHPSCPLLSTLPRPLTPSRLRTSAPGLGCKMHAVYSLLCVPVLIGRGAADCYLVHVHCVPKKHPRHFWL